MVDYEDRYKKMCLNININRFSFYFKSRLDSSFLICILMSYIHCHPFGFIQNIIYIVEQNDMTKH